MCLDVINQTWSPMFGVLPSSRLRRDACGDGGGSATLGWRGRGRHGGVCAAPDSPAPRRGAADLLNVFDVFLPQLLLYPNPADPLNGEAAALMLREPDRYNAKIRGLRPATPAIPATPPPLPTHALSAVRVWAQTTSRSMGRRRPLRRRRARRRVRTTTTTDLPPPASECDCVM